MLLSAAHLSGLGKNYADRNVTELCHTKELGLHKAYTMELGLHEPPHLRDSTRHHDFVYSVLTRIIDSVEIWEK